MVRKTDEKQQNPMAKPKTPKLLQPHNDPFIMKFLRIFRIKAQLIVVTWDEFCELHGLDPDPPHDERYSMVARKLKREVEIMRANGWQAHPELIHGQRVWVNRPLSHEQVLALRGNVED